VTTPLFAVVGHPNKGKSSIVSTLAQDDSVAISPVPGTTVSDRTYPMIVDDEVLYVLVDTPGFQRARAALEWMQRQAGSAHERPAIVRRFVEAHLDDPRFVAECNLLEPVLDGAGILYVVDGSRPFGEDYEAEMEILRWTGQPSMALINMIGSGDYREQWSNALSQYFRIVRVFDALTADFDRRVQLLLAFGQLREEWRDALQRAVRVLEEEQQRRRTLAARVIAETISQMLSLTRRRRLDRDGRGSAAVQEALQQEYRQALAALEQRCRSEVEQLYSHRQLQRHEGLVRLLDEDLFATQTWTLFGLTRRQLVGTGAVGGAAAGSVIDVVTGGHSLLLGAGVGGLIGGASAWLGADRIADIRVLGSPLGGKELCVGPMRNINFPYVVLARALLHHRMIEDRTHACRGPLELKEAPGEFQITDAASRKRLEKLFARMRKRDAPGPELLDRLSEEIESLMRVSATSTSGTAEDLL